MDSYLLTILINYLDLEIKVLLLNVFYLEYPTEAVIRSITCVKISHSVLLILQLALF